MAKPQRIILESAVDDYLTEYFGDCLQFKRTISTKGYKKTYKSSCIPANSIILFNEWLDEKLEEGNIGFSFYGRDS
jgi:hypothetical protein